MKTLKDTLGNNGYLSVPMLEDEDMVTFVSWPGVDFDIPPTKTSELECPACHGKNIAKLLCCHHREQKGAFCLSCCQEHRYPRIKEEQGVPEKKALLVGLPTEFMGATLEGIDDKPQAFINAVKAYADNPSGYFLMAGLAGVGKTYAAAAIMKNIEEKGKETRYIESMELYQEWLEVAPKYLHLLNMLQSIYFLIIDDFGHKSSSESYNEFLHMLFSKRKSTQKPTVIITNLTSEKMAENTKSAIYSRVTSNIILKLEGKDRRIRKF